MTTFGINENKKKIEGRLILAILEQYNEKTFRGTIRSMETGARQTCVMTPNEGVGIMPKENSIIVVYQRSGFIARYLFPVSRIDDKRTNVQKIFNDVGALVSETLIDQPALWAKGESMIGSMGSANLFFNDVGSAKMSNDAGNLFLEMSEPLSKTTMCGNNFLVETPGSGIRIETQASVPTAFGDILRITKNIPLPSLPEEITGIPPVLTALSVIEMDELGGIKLESVISGAKLEITSLGNIELSNSLSSLTLDPTGVVELKNNLASLTMDTAGGVDLTGNNVDITAVTGVATLTGTSLVKLDAALIKFGDSAVNHVAQSELLVELLEAVRDFQVAVKTHTHSVTGTVTTGAGAGGLVVGAAAQSGQLMVAPLSDVPTLQNTGSLTVTVQS